MLIMSCIHRLLLMQQKKHLEEKENATKSKRNDKNNT